MRSDWERRAREDACYYTAFGRREQEEAEFQQSAGDVVRNLDRELRRLPQLASEEDPSLTVGARIGASALGTQASLRALEIGCGPGRVMLPMSLRFVEIHGVDISEEMIRLARERLASAPNAHVQVNSGADLGAFADDWFDFVYSYAVFQHIPSLEIVLGYLRETHRVLKPGGLVRCQINGLPASAAEYDTWQGVRISGAQIREFALANDFQLLALEGAGTQYMWVTLAKRPTGWHASLVRRRTPSPAAIRRLTNAFGTEPLATSRGRFAAISLWIEALPPECDLLHLGVSIGGLSANPFYIGPVENDGLSQLNIALPAEIESGLQPVQLKALDEPLCPPAILRVVPPGPNVARVVALSDAVDLLSGTTIRSGIVKLVLEDVEGVAGFRASLDGRELSRFESFCIDPVPMRYEINVYLPSGPPPGRHSLEVGLGGRKLGSFALLLV
jgi:SAM-dependent methyltransferase